jgi:predicted 3-demethylubiquinone-9 3-methyltransferase (glyoxalase superfamily)
MPTITPFLGFDGQATAARVMKAMMRMKKIDIAALERAAET